jgi:hypothetical protein
MLRKSLSTWNISELEPFLKDLGMFGKLLLLIVFGRSRHADRALDACAAVEREVNVGGVIATMRNIARQHRRQ